MVLTRIVKLNFITGFLLGLSSACSRSRDNELPLRNDDLFILEMGEHILLPSLKAHIMEENEITMTIRPGKREEFEELTINITALWDGEQRKGSNMTIDPPVVTLSNQEDVQEITISDLQLPAEQQGETKLLIIANGTNCDIDDPECNVTLSKILRRHILIKNVTRDTEPLPKPDFNRKYRGCNNASRSEERCNHENWQVDFIIPSSTFPSGLSKVKLRNKDFGIDDDVRFWHRNFDIGTTEEVEFSTNATCCAESVTIEVIGVSSGESHMINVLSDGSSDARKICQSQFNLLPMILGIVTLFQI